MTQVTKELYCIHCKTSENETPLLHLQYRGEKLWICSHCLPILIHAPQKLAGKIQSADQIKPAKHPSH
jgi:hypothetical protein